MGGSFSSLRGKLGLHSQWLGGWVWCQVRGGPALCVCVCVRVSACAGDGGASGGLGERLTRKECGFLPALGLFGTIS